MEKRKRKGETKGEGAEERVDVWVPRNTSCGDENGCGWPGPAVVRVAPECAIGASTSPKVVSFFCFRVCLCLCFLVCVCVVALLRLHLV